MMEMSNKLKKVDRSKLSDRVHTELSSLLISGQLSPGDMFSLRGLADTLGTSAMPVREAVGRLVAERALEILPNRAIRVPLMTVSRFLELRTIRIELEGLATARAAVNRSQKQLNRIQDIQMQFEVARKSGEPNGKAAVRLNKNLHFCVYGAAGMPILFDMIEVLWLQIGPVLNYDLAVNSERLTNRQAHIHHKNMVEGIKMKQPEPARAALVADLMSASELIIQKNVLSPG
ncbi:GntR family transcriptional regulator [Advenella incenata]|jgi:DNA-binding GntR family transcriptional regulator|uniref:GntR family transcriptional regulator n=2 Tax=Advenella incenata TaxID=267800 RepID=A0A4Q7VVH7_9BURK|nr:GntR family transcriptional regulator [Advenella incenata]